MRLDTIVKLMGIPRRSVSGKPHRALALLILHPSWNPHANNWKSTPGVAGLALVCQGAQQFRAPLQFSKEVEGQPYPDLEK